MKKYIQLSAIILLVFSFNTSSLGQSYIHYFADEGSHPREHAVDMQHMKVEVRFEPQKTALNSQGPPLNSIEPR